MIRNFILLFLVLGLLVSIQAQTPQSKLRIEFEGNKIFSSDALLEKLNSCITKHSDSDEEYDARLFDYCLQTGIRKFMQSQGYLNAKVSETKSQNSDQSLKITIPIEEGLRFRLGSIDIQGAKVFTSEQLLEKLNLKAGDIADNQELFQWLFERVKKLYEDKGYVQSEFEINPTFKHNTEKVTEGIVDLEVVIDEGLRFMTSRVKFIGNERTSDQVLRSTLLIREGEPFNQQKLADSVKKLNDLGLFEFIDKDKDVELRTDRESPLLQINILIKERNTFESNVTHARSLGMTAKH